MTPAIAIVGGGPGGLTTARLLSLANIPYVVYELREAPTSIDTEPSGSLDLHTESGQLALEKCGLLADFQTIIREGGEDTILADKDSNVLMSRLDDGTGRRPEVDRSQLAKLLRDSIPKSNVKYSHKVTNITPTPDGKYTLSFTTQPSQSHTTVIGADGAWSRVRPLLTEVQPLCSGVSCITMHISNISSHAVLSNRVGRGSFMALSPTKSLMAQSSNTDTLRVYLMIWHPAEDMLSSIGIDWTNHSAAKNRFTHEEIFFGSWGTEIKELIMATDESIPISAKPLYMLPVGHRWPSRSGITLLGDAAHLMTPFAGEGVNAAMLDAVELAEALTQAYEGMRRSRRKV
jgi:2-polyprenyl-6-methoxyphenol hydroxylase-like FAD-dependent oxidoreductase